VARWGSETGCGTTKADALIASRRTVVVKILNLRHRVPDAFNPFGPLADGPEVDAEIV
jgi:hypothetical protein